MSKQDFVLGLDLDNVCADYTAGFRKYVAEVQGRDESEYPNPTDWDFVQCEGWNIDSREHFEELHAGAVKSGMMRNLPEMEGCSEALWRLSDAGVYIRIITHRLVIKRLHLMTGVDTLEWLENSNLPYRDICMVATKVDVGADLYLDDGPRNILAMQQAGLECAVFDAEYNRFLTGPRVSNWQEAETLIRTRAGL